MNRSRRKECSKKGNNATAVVNKYTADQDGSTGRLAHHAPCVDNVLLSRSGAPKHQPRNLRQHARRSRNRHQRLQHRTDHISCVIPGRRAPWRVDQQESRTVPLHTGGDRAMGWNLDGSGRHEFSLEFLVAEGTLGIGSRWLHPRHGALLDNNVVPCEALLTVGQILYSSYFYKSSELSIRMSWFYTGIPLTQAWGSLLAGGILKMRGISCWGGWQWLYGPSCQHGW